MGNQPGGNFTVVEDEDKDDQNEKITIKIVSPFFMDRVSHIDIRDDGADILDSSLALTNAEKKQKFINKVAKQEDILGSTLDRETRIKPYVPKEEDRLEGLLGLIKIEDRKPLSKGATKEDLIRIGKQIITVLRDPMLVGRLLEGIEKSITDDMQAKGIVFSKSDLPEIFISTYGGYLIPGPPPVGYEMRSKGRMIDSVLLEHEMEAGINQGGYSPRFVGFVDPGNANEIVASGNLFGEDAQVDNLITHGKFSHRLQMEVIRQAIKEEKISLTLENGQELDHKELLAVMVGTKPSLWDIVLDSILDNKDGVAADRFNPKNHSFSCTGAENINSLIMCFGNLIGLPNLQHAMLDSHWKETNKFVQRIRESDSGNELSTKSDAELYISCMALMGRKIDSETIEQSVLTMTPPDAFRAGVKSGKYVKTDSSGVVKKSPQESISPQNAKKMGGMPPLSLGGNS